MQMLCLLHLLNDRERLYIFNSAGTIDSEQHTVWYKGAIVESLAAFLAAIFVLNTSLYQAIFTLKSLDLPYLRLMATC